MIMDFISIDDYLETREDNYYFKAFYYSIFVGFLIVLIIVILSLLKTKYYYQNILTFNQKEIILCVNYKDIDRILKNHYMIINNKKYRYDVYNVQLINENIIYYRINIKMNLGDIDLKEGVLDYYIYFKEESLLRCLVNVIRGD